MRAALLNGWLPAVIFSDGSVATHDTRANAEALTWRPNLGALYEANVPLRLLSRVRLYHLVRTRDVSGVSGLGVVAEVAEFDGGPCAMRWLTKTSSTGFYASAEELIDIHGHEGATRLISLVQDGQSLPQAA